MLNLKELIEATEGVYINGNLEYIPQNYVIDSRLIKKDDFFVPIIGENTDGHKYIIQSMKNGACGFFISKKCEEKDNIIKEAININKEAVIIEVEDTFKALYNAGKVNREKHIDIPLVAVTGSVGKTSTREMISCVLGTSKNVLKTEKNYNSLIGVPIMALKIDKQDICVLEVGIDHFDEMELLSDEVKPDVCVLTNIGTAHIGTFKTSENILKEKIQITNHIRGISKVVVNQDNSYLSNLSNNLKYKIEKIGIDMVKDIVNKNDYIEFTTRIYNEECRLRINAIGKHNIYNALVAIKVGEIFDISKENIIKGVSEYRNFSRRLEKKVTKKGVILIDDTYNASIDSMKSGLITINSMEGRKFAVLGDMFDLGEKSDEIHKKLSDVFEILDYDYLYTLGDASKNIAEGAKRFMKKENIECFDDKEAIIKKMNSMLKKDDIVYLKASNGMKFNEIIEKID